MACLQAIGRLTRLTFLDLRGNDGLARQGLMQLTWLSCLQDLKVSGGPQDTKADDRKAFCTAVLQQPQ
jgi:hypothetical protein